MWSTAYSDSKVILWRSQINSTSSTYAFSVTNLNLHLWYPVRCFKNTYECKDSSDCTLDDGVVVHNWDTITAYQAPIVAQWLSCQSEQVTCTNGTLNGTYRYSTCEV